MVGPQRASGIPPDEDNRAALREKLNEKNRRLKNLRRLLEEKEKEATELRAETARFRGAQYMPDLDYGSAPVFFVVGRAKSGTSWLMRLLNYHPEILCRGEGRFFGREFKREEPKEGEDGGRIQPTSLYRAFLEADYLRAWIERSVWSRGDEAEGHLINLTRLATHYFLAQRLAESGKRIVGDKSPFVSTDIVEETHAIYPEAKVLHIIRDGRDAAVSLNHHRWNKAVDQGGIYKLEPEELQRRKAYRQDSQGSTAPPAEGMFTEKSIRAVAAGWRKQISHAREDGKNLFGDRYAEVRYEDLLTNPEGETARLLRFLEADDSAEVVRKCVEQASFESWTKGRERGQEDPSSFFRKGIAGDWRNVFSEADRRIFKEEAGDLLVQLGYERDLDW